MDHGSGKGNAFIPLGVLSQITYLSRYLASLDFHYLKEEILCLKKKRKKNSNT